MEKKKYISEIPHLMKEWDWEANANLDPQKLTVGSNKKVWWICHLCGHKWQTTIYHRAQNGRCCPNCHHGRWTKVQRSTDSQINPNIAQDWHPIKNGKLTPDMFTKGSRYEAWWKCHICGKEIKKSIKGYNGCRDCKKQEYLNKNNLAITNPQLLKEWDYEKNSSIMPSQVLASNPKKVWWVCKKCGHNWQAKISNRAVLGRSCPCCANKVVVVGKNDLATTHSDLAKEWHSSKNGNLTPDKVTYGTNKKVWWICPHGHEYQATINHRTGEKGTNCPICMSGRQTSFAEQAFYFYIKKLYPDAINRYKADFLGKMELDIYIPSIKWAIEYDGVAFHTEDKLKREQKKYNICKKNKIKLIRFREKELVLGQDIADESYHTPDMSNPKNLEKMIIHFLHKLDFSSKYSFQINSFNVNVKKDRIKILKSYSTEYKKDSFGELYPEIAKEWHSIKNEGLTPYMFKPGSNHKVWWLCPKCGYEYKASISHRTNPKNRKRATGCPKCGIEKSSQAKRKAINMVDPKTNKVIRTFISIADASRKMKISHGNIGMVCQGIRPKAGGYIWRYADEQETKKYHKSKKQLEFDFK